MKISHQTAIVMYLKNMIHRHKDPLKAKMKQEMIKVLYIN